MAPNYKLTYFNVAALAEPIRFLFNYGGIPFEDIRIDFNDWPKIKPTMPYGAVPILEVDGKVINQSEPITRYLAKKLKLVGKDDWEDLEIDAAVQNFNDIRTKISSYYWETNEESKASQKKLLFEETMPFYLERLDKQVEKNNGHMAVGRLTWADFYFVAFLPYLNFIIQEDLTGKYPNLAKLKNTILAIPSIKAWIAKRPKYDMYLE